MPSGVWRHFRSGIAAQRAEPGARRVDEHAVDLAGEPLDAVVALVRDLHRVHVRQAAARQPRLQRRQPVARRVERVEPPGVAHLRAERQRLAAGAGAEVDDHLAALRAGDQRQQLAALVLDLDVAAQEDVELMQRRLAVDAQAERRIRRVDRLDAERRQLAAHAVAIRLQRVDPQVERRRVLDRLDERPELVAERRLQAIGEPLRQVVAQPLGQRRRGRRRGPAPAIAARSR